MNGVIDLNYLLTIIFITFVLFMYKLVGKTILKPLNLKISNSIDTFQIITGWLTVFGIGWVIGVICQLFSTSWIFFSIVYGSSLIILLILCLYLNKQEITCLNGKNIINKLVNNIRNHWFIYLAAFIFTIFSMINMQPYILNNYSDDHYIIKVFHLAHSSHLLNEDYSAGNPLFFTSRFSYAKAQGYRALNTYELLYSFFGSLFHISLVFFCRCTMTFHNYVVIFFIVKLFASIFVDEKISQFSILFIFLLLIPAGYAAKGDLPFKIRMYENWRFQTAIYMGGSIVRTSFFPLTLYLLYLIVLNKEFNLIPIYILFWIVMISYHTTAISYIIFTTPIILGILLFLIVLNKIEVNSKIIVSSLSICLAVIAVYYLFEIIVNSAFNSMPDIILKLQHFSKTIDLKTLQSSFKSYNKYYINSFTFDLFAKFAIIPTLILLLVSDKKGRIIGAMILIMYLVFALKILKNSLVLISFTFFNAARLLTSMQLLVAYIFGVSLLLLIEFLFKDSIQKSYASSAVISLLLPALIISFNVKSQDKLVKYTAAGDSMTKYGYSIEPIIANDKMIPEPILQIGNYFSRHNKNKINVLCQYEIPINNIKYPMASLLLASTSVKLVSNTLHTENKISIKESKLISYELEMFLEGKRNYNVVRNILREYKIDYIITTNQKISKILIGKGYKLSYLSNKYYINIFKNKYAD